MTCALCFELATVCVGTRYTDLHTCIDTDKSNTSSKTGIDVVRTFSDIWTGMVTDNVLGRLDHWRNVGINELIRIRSLAGCFEGGMVCRTLV